MSKKIPTNAVEKDLFNEPSKQVGALLDV